MKRFSNSGRGNVYLIALIVYIGCVLRISTSMLLYSVELLTCDSSKFWDQGLKALILVGDAGQEVSGMAFKHHEVGTFFVYRTSVRYFTSAVEVQNQCAV